LLFFGINELDHKFSYPLHNIHNIFDYIKVIDNCLSIHDYCSFQDNSIRNYSISNFFHLTHIGFSMSEKNLGIFESRRYRLNKSEKNLPKLKLKELLKIGYKQH
jgi:hypothetical protein